MITIFAQSPKRADQENAWGDPLYVYAEELSFAAILDGLRRRRVYMSKGPRVIFRAKVNGNTFEIGADLGEQSKKIAFTATVLDNTNGVRIQIIKNGTVFAEGQLRGERTSLRCSDQPNPTSSHWYRLDVIDKGGQPLVITNPIFVGPRREPGHHVYGNFI